VTVFFVAYCGPEYVFAATRLQSVLDYVADYQARSAFAEDVAVWAGPRLAALCRFGADAVTFDVPPPRPTAPPWGWQPGA
jgi:hypothetical protein